MRQGASMSEHRAQQDGAVALEFALIAPILILLFFGIIFFGLTIFRMQVVESATREAARAMAVGADDDAIEAALEGAAPTFAAGEIDVLGYRRDGGVVNVAGSDKPCDGTADTATVTAGVPSDVTRFDFSIPFGGTYTPQLRATATFRCET